MHSKSIQQYGLIRDVTEDDSDRVLMEDDSDRVLMEDDSDCVATVVIERKIYTDLSGKIPQHIQYELPQGWGLKVPRPKGVHVNYDVFDESVAICPAWYDDIHSFYDVYCSEDETT